ncbi:MAG: cysteine desulfurase [Gammaproteobacteria bacterium]|nr:cysteine desulfurase [Gammaproteobacteria bacterium]MBU6510606.1 cysteine desulfurase [Gammaproteobacteria bacterium]MDE1984769.1 cysteine desulfurase [Gammaproteobacteria bacterium]MDE2460954.1 cysteine desulfurase [Gammaproteobacteria bacterium]
MSALTSLRAAAKPAVADFDPLHWRRDFPILGQKVHGKPLIYLDNAATAQKPQSVIDAVAQFYSQSNSNVHRGVHALSERATAQYEAARAKVRDFLHAASTCEIVFTRGTTESLNLIAQSYGRSHLRAGDEIILSHLEHHSNIVPWQLLAEQLHLDIKVIPITDTGELLPGAYEHLFSPRTRLVALAHVSNALGTLNPVREMTAIAHRHHALVVLDGAQAVPHLPVDVQELDCDFYAFSGHKLFGPTGIGVLYGREALLAEMPPWQGGGDMIRTVRFSGSTWNELPYKFEAGTPHIAGAIGLGAAIEYLNAVGMDNIAHYDRELLGYGARELQRIQGLKLIGTAPHKAGVLSFVMQGVHPHDIGTIVDQEGVAIRTGHHCAMPVMERFGIPATARASLAFYNTRADLDALVAALGKVREVFR